MTDWICFVFAIVSLFEITLIGLKSPLSYLITYVLDFLENLRVFILTVYHVYRGTVMELVLTLLAPWLVPGSHSATFT